MIVNDSEPPYLALTHLSQLLCVLICVHRSIEKSNSVELYRLLGSSSVQDFGASSQISDFSSAPRQLSRKRGIIAIISFNH